MKKHFSRKNRAYFCYLFFFVPIVVLLSQVPINPYMYGQNAWNVAVGNPSGNPTQLDTMYSPVALSGVKFVRIGGAGPNFNPLYTFNLTTPNQWAISDAHSLIYIIDSLRSHNMEPVIEVSIDLSGCSSSSFPLSYNGVSMANQATIAGNLVSYLKNYYPTRPIKYWIIGNEPDQPISCSGQGRGNGLDGSSSNVNAHALAISQYIKAFATAMKDADNTIKIIGPELASFGTDAQFWSPSLVMAQLISPTSNGNSIMGTISSSGAGNGKYFIDIVSIHDYPQGITTRAGVIAEPTSIDGIKNKLIINTPTSSPPRKGLVPFITAAGRSVSNCKIAITELNLTANGDTGDESTAYSTICAGIGNRSFLAGQWLAEVLSYGLETNSSNTPWVELMMPWSVREGNCTSSSTAVTFGYFSGCSSNYNRRRSTYWHYRLMANYLTGTFFRGTVTNDPNSNPSNIKVFSGSSCNGVNIMILNQNQSSNNIDINFNSVTPTTSNTRVTLNTGVSGFANYNITVGAEETVMLIFDACGKLKRKYVYNLSRNQSNLGPLLTTYNGPRSCVCAITSPTNTLRCAVSTETGSVHYDNYTLRSNVRMKDSAYITGTFTVPRGFKLTIDTAEVSFGTNAKIVVQSGGSLEINKSFLHDCPGNQWGGINVTGNGSSPSFTINNSVIENAKVAITCDNAFKPEITENLFNNCGQGIRINSGSQFNISGNEFTGVLNCIKTSSSTAGASYISENMFYQADTAVVFKDDSHSQLTISCNAFISYRYYGIYATGGTLKDQGTDSYGPGNYFSSESTNTNHRLYFTGTSGMIYHPDPSYNFTLSLSSPMTATASTAAADGSCETILGRLAHYGINTEPEASAVNKSYLINCIPNPTSDKTTLTFSLEDGIHSAQINISNLFGELIRTIPIQLGTKSVETNVSNLSNGIYAYTLVVNGRIVDSKKVVVSK